MNENLNITLIGYFYFTSQSSFCQTYSHTLAVMRFVSFQADNFTVRYLVFFTCRKRFLCLIQVVNKCNADAVRDWLVDCSKRQPGEGFLLFFVYFSTSPISFMPVSLFS